LVNCDTAYAWHEAVWGIDEDDQPLAGVPLETRKVLLGHRNGDITTHYSAPELEELIEAANRVCENQSGKSPALVVLRHKGENRQTG
jgi:hypothetical protein